MLDISTKPTATDIAIKARLLYYFARSTAQYTADSGIDDRESIETIFSNVELMEELSKELYYMTQVFDDYARYTDFAECVPSEFDTQAPRKSYEAGKRAGYSQGFLAALLKLSGADQHREEAEPVTRWTPEERKAKEQELLQLLGKLGLVSSASDPNAAEQAAAKDGEPV